MALSAVGDVSVNVRFDSTPVILIRQQFAGFGPSWVCCGEGGVGFTDQLHSEAVNVWNYKLAPAEQQVLLHFPTITAGEVSVLLQGVMFAIHFQNLVDELECTCLGLFVWLRRLLGVIVCGGRCC